MRSICKSVLAVTVFMLTLGACARSPSNLSISNAPLPNNGKKNNNNKKNNNKKPPNAYLLFQTTQTAAEVAAAKLLFRQTPIEKMANLAPGAFNPAEFDMFNLGSIRHVMISDLAGNERMMATSPVVGTYGAPDVEVSLSVSLPREFRNNIPLNIKNEILKYRLDSLEVYFSPQRVRGNVGNPGSDARLRTHFWYLQADHPLGTNVEADLLMGIYNSDHAIAGDVLSDQVSSHNVSIHPQGGITAYSPPNTMLNFNQTMLNMSFWSLVIDQDGKRAVVTLHWLLNNPTHTALIGHLNAMAAAFPGANVLDQLTDLLDIDPLFQATPMLGKLKDLIQ